MSVEENKTLCRRFAEEGWKKDNSSIYYELMTPDCPHYMNGIVNFKGPEGTKRVLETWLKGFPNIQVTIEDLIGEGDKVVMRSKLKAKHEGPLQFEPMPFEIPATGKLLEMEMLTIIRVEDGKIVEWRDTGDYSWIREFAKRK